MKELVIQRPMPCNKIDCKFHGLVTIVSREPINTWHTKALREKSAIMGGMPCGFCKDFIGFSFYEKIDAEKVKTRDNSRKLGN